MENNLAVPKKCFIFAVNNHKPNTQFNTQDI